MKRIRYTAGLAAVGVALVSLLIMPVLVVFAAAPASWTTPDTSWSTGDLVTATTFSEMNTNIAALGNGSTGTNVACSTADVTVNNSTTLTNVTGTSMGIGASEKWIFMAFVFGQSNAAADFDFAFSGPAGPTSLRYHVTGQAPLSTYATAYGSRVSVGSNGAATANFYIVGGYVVNGSTAGNIVLRFSQNVVNATDSTIYNGTCLFGWRVP